LAFLGSLDAVLVPLPAPLPVDFPVADFAAGFNEQFLLVHCSLIMIDPHVQNCDKQITPL
jgi:hypothetical protein